MSLTTDPHEGCLHEIGQDGQQKCYLILPDGERKDLARAVRISYKHQVCGAITTMNRAIAETYAADPAFYDATYCAVCRAHFPVGENGEFTWLDGSKVGT